MQKQLFVFIITIIPLCGFTQSTVEGCSEKAPGWGTHLGTVTFQSPQTWRIGHLEWSDVVHASNCDKKTFSGTDTVTRVYISDCRENADGYGDLFSWCAIVLYQRQLCPRGWRIPTVNDFIMVDEHYGGNGDRRKLDAETFVLYERSGGANGGFCEENGNLKGQGSETYYWSLSEHSASNGYRCNYFKEDGYISPQGYGDKGVGHTLRCVR
ncbi:MAG: fibrobacter succinogenes major paralogous domain-containing protein [Bacteroidales bacterium]|nr:fibrobacter succinogenes major paralogous domain-containing protein [Bacteroidales bacterium]